MAEDVKLREDLGSALRVVLWVMIVILSRSDQRHLGIDGKYVINHHYEAAQYDSLLRTGRQCGCDRLSFT